MFGKSVFALVVLVALSACTSRGGLHDFRLKPGEGPDEFKVTTQKPLQDPANYTELPPPGGQNRADLNPRADAAEALGGSSRARGIPAADGALVRHTGRFGTEADIRATLDADDAQYRKRRGGIRILSRGDKYYQVYSPMALDARSEQDRFRRQGVRVPSAPPRQ